jgi:PBP1b-binding outer membrane lipoprotein LpoB
VFLNKCVRQRFGRVINTMSNKNSLVIIISILALYAIVTTGCSSNAATSNNANAEPDVVAVTTGPSEHRPDPDVR